MKTITIILVILVVLFVVAQLLISRSTNKTEGHAYTVVKEFDGFEIRQYEAAIFSYTVMPSGSYKTTSSKGFSRLAGYIFGGNSKNEKIAMTSPVSMTMSDSITMKFKIPDGMSLEDLPKPNNVNVQFKEEPEKMVAAMRFAGRASDEVIQQSINRLQALLDAEGIDYHGDFTYLGYNPPYQVVNRRNEVMVEVTYNP